MKKIPSKVRVGAVDYKVVFQTPEQLGGYKRDYAGFIDYTLSEIYISRALGIQEQWTTLWHEILHAVCYEMNVKMSEDDTERLSRMILSTLRDNQGVTP